MGTLRVNTVKVQTDLGTAVLHGISLNPGTTSLTHVALNIQDNFTPRPSFEAIRKEQVRLLRKGEIEVGTLKGNYDMTSFKFVRVSRFGEGVEGKLTSKGVDLLRPLNELIREAEEHHGHHEGEFV